MIHRDEQAIVGEVISFIDIDRIRLSDHSLKGINRIFTPNYLG